MWLGMVLFVVAAADGNATRSFAINAVDARAVEAQDTPADAARWAGAPASAIGEELGSEHDQGLLVSCCYVNGVCSVMSTCPEGTMAGPCPCRDVE